MFINDVMTKIWEPVTQEYKKAYEEALTHTPQELFKRHTEIKMKYFPYIGVNMNYINTTGCPYRMSGGKLSGCSMCNYQSELAQMQGSLLALRKKDPALYAQAVRMEFQNSRGKNASATAIENVSGYDTLDMNEVPQELCDELFKNELFEQRPFIYNVEARASTITEARLKAFKQTVSDKKRVSIDFGVEISDDWMRNNWLNKNVTNSQIETAVSLLHEYGFKAVGNVILGIPGLTEKQTTDLFVKTVVWMDSVGIDKIVIHALNRKKYTLHGYIYEKLRDVPELSDVGLVRGEHTGLPWLFTIAEALEAIYRTDKKLFDKAVMVKIDTNFNSIKNEISYNADNDCSCNDDMKNYLNSLALSKDYSTLPSAVQEFKADPCYKEYEALLQNQEKCGGLPDTLRLLGKHLARSVFGEQWESEYATFIVPDDIG